MSGLMRYYHRCHLNKYKNLSHKAKVLRGPFKFLPSTVGHRHVNGDNFRGRVYTAGRLDTDGVFARYSTGIKCIQVDVPQLQRPTDSRGEIQRAY